MRIDTPKSLPPLLCPDQSALTQWSHLLEPHMRKYKHTFASDNLQSGCKHASQGRSYTSINGQLRTSLQKRSLTWGSTDKLGFWGLWELRMRAQKVVTLEPSHLLGPSYKRAGLPKWHLWLVTPSPLYKDRNLLFIHCQDSQRPYSRWIPPFSIMLLVFISFLFPLSYYHLDNHPLPCLQVNITLRVISDSNWWV